ncbi:MAG: DUF4956 domain-containing protein [Bacteroidales bacterium]|nr:DUF4956 domain-containing protein [Bacteroidales bacterium]
MLNLLQALPEFDPSIAEEFGSGMTASTFLGVPVFESGAFLNLLLRFSFNLIIALVIVHFLYYKRKGRKDYYFTFLLFSTTMFLLIFLMENVKLQIGFTLGLFAIFGMIRYRTETVPVREMTYLFIIIGISVINGLALNISIAELLLANTLLLGIIWGVEATAVKRRRGSKTIVYDRIDLIVPQKKPEMIEDLQKRTGLDIVDFEVGNIDFIRDCAFVKIHYVLPKGGSDGPDITKLTAES